MKVLYIRETIEFYDKIGTEEMLLLCFILNLSGLFHEFLSVVQKRKNKFSLLFRLII
jgi:hypothetical protein